MLRRQSNPPGSVFRGNESMRLLTMVVMLGVVYLLIVRARDPHTWTWLTGGAGAADQQDAIASAGADKNDNKRPQDSPATGASSRAGAFKAELPASSLPTDIDPEEAEAAKEEFQAVIDGSENIQPQEMFAYKRLLNWVCSQTFAEMSRRADKNVAFNKFYQSPDEYRGQLFKFNLTVQLARDLDKKHDGVELFDIWGTTEESGAWLYNAVVIGLPKGMSIGRNIEEKVSLAGYFFKLQGYQPAGAKPGDKPLKAPLFVGRLVWRPAGKQQARGSDWSWGLLLLAGFLIFLTIRWWLLLRAGRGRLYSPPTIQVNPGGNPVDDWLTKVETDEQDKPADNKEGTDNL
jgi:hypothetical protein